MFDEDLVLLGEDGAPFFDRFKPVAFQVSGKIWVNNHAHVLRPVSNLDPRFLAHALNSVDYRAFIDGSTRDKLTQGDMNAIPIQLPSFEEQRAIAEFLDREAGKIDALVAKKERLIDLLQEKRTALITHAVTRGLDPDVPMKGSGVEYLSEIPAHWGVKPNGVLFRERDERGFPELPILNVSINTGVAIREFSEEKIEQKAEDPAIYKRAKQGDITFNKMRMWQGAVGVAPVDGLVSPDYTVATPDPMIEPRYYEFLFRTSFYKAEINRHSHGIVPDRNRLYWDEFKQIKSLVPPPLEQRRILNWINAETGKLAALVSKIREGIDRLKEYRTALISAAMTGKIDVREEVA